MKKTLLLILLSVCMVCCTNDFIEPTKGLINADNSVSNIVDETTVSPKDIANIVSSFNLRNKSRAEKNYTTSVITDDNSNPLIYVVNFDDNGGFILISATKDFHPILAYNYEGHYNVNSTVPSGLDVWENDMKTAIQEAKNQDIDSIKSNRMEWTIYSSKNLPKPAKPLSIGYEFITEEEYQELIPIYNQAVDDLVNNKYDVYDYPSWSSKLFESQLYDAENRAREVYWMYEDIWSDFAIMAIHDDYEDFYTEKTVKSIWNQLHPYNQVFPPTDNLVHAYAGCGPVAMGQIMRYYEHPVKYNWIWSQMPLNYGTRETSVFLYELAKMADARFLDSGTPVSYGDIINTMKACGYEVTHNAAPREKDIYQSLSNGMPAIILGTNPSTGIGHAWVASQAHVTEWTTHYDIYNFTGWKKYGRIGEFHTMYRTTYYFYFNWGWGGSQNGYFLFNNHSYNNDIKAIYNIKPKNIKS
ncbi:MAG: C10 family peptidase [Bacteroides sp.]|nr:C10 family peptidase [Bacteroides sp.]MCM1456864.1 C10 family peptidase [Lachnoclostridium sp.]